MQFSSFQLHSRIEAGIKVCGYATPTPIQQQAIPSVLEGRDLMGLAQTGTGKTAAFALPLLQRLIDGPRRVIRALVIAPTRELAEQIHENIGLLGRETGIRSVSVYGGVSKFNQAKAIRAGVEIVVACPGRLLDHMHDGTIRLDKVEALVLDEADHMFDMGFLPNIRKILSHLPAKRQTLLFSATMPPEIRTLAEDILNNPVMVKIAPSKPADTVDQLLYAVPHSRKYDLLKAIMAEEQMESTLIFTRTKHRAKSLARQLEQEGLSVTSIQGNLSQQKRQQAMTGFRSGHFKVLVATDIAARGIDVSGISHVINYDIPDTTDAYTHRIGRTGRAACTGKALTFACPEDRGMVRDIEKILGRPLHRAEISGLVFSQQDWQTPAPPKQTSGLRRNRPPLGSAPSPRLERPQGNNKVATGQDRRQQHAAPSPRKDTARTGQGVKQQENKRTIFGLRRDSSKTSSGNWRKRS